MGLSQVKKASLMGLATKVITSEPTYRDMYRFRRSSFTA